MQVRITYTTDDYVEASAAQASLGRRRERWLLGGMGFAILVSGTYLMWKGDTKGSLVISGFGVMVLLWWPFFRWWMGQRFKNHPALANEFEFTFSDDGVRCRSAVSDSTIAWNALTKYSETESQLLMHFGPGSAISVPKRVLSAEECTSLKKLLASKLPEL